MEHIDRTSFWWQFQSRSGAEQTFGGGSVSQMDLRCKNSQQVILCDRDISSPVYNWLHHVIWIWCMLMMPQVLVTVAVPWLCQTFFFIWPIHLCIFRKITGYKGLLQRLWSTSRMSQWELIHLQFSLNKSPVTSAAPCSFGQLTLGDVNKLNNCVINLTTAGENSSKQPFQHDEWTRLRMSLEHGGY